MPEVPRIPDSIDISDRYKNHERTEKIKEVIEGWLIGLARSQYALDQTDKKERVHDGVGVALMHTPGFEIRHAYRLGKNSVIGDVSCSTPLRGPNETEKHYGARLEKFYEQLAAFESPETKKIGLQFMDGATVFGPDGNVLEGRVYLKAQDCVVEKLPPEGNTRNLALFATSGLDETICTWGLSEETNRVRRFSLGKDVDLICDPAAEATKAAEEAEVSNSK